MAEATNKTERTDVNEWAHSEPENRPEVTPSKRPMNPEIVDYRESLYQQIKEIHKGGAKDVRI